MLSTGHSVVLHLCHPSPFIPLYVSLSLFLSDCRSNCVAGSDRCAILLLLCMKGGKKKKNTSCPPHVCSLFRATEVLAPLHWFTHTLSHSVALCVSLQVNSRMQMSAFFTSWTTAWSMYRKKKSVCAYARACGLACVCVSFWPRGWEGSDRGLDMLKRQSKWVFLKQWRKYHRFMPGQFMSPYLFLKHVTLATAEW